MKRLDYREYPTQEPFAQRRRSTLLDDISSTLSYPILRAFYIRPISQRISRLPIFTSATYVTVFGFSYSPLPDKPLLSNVYMQQLIYFNTPFAFIYALIQILLFAWKYKNSSGWQVEYVTPIVMILYIIVEPARLYLAWQGNLREQVPQLAACLFLSVFICPIFIIYNIRFQEPVTGLDKALAWIYMGFVILELLFGLFAIRAVIGYRTSRFPVEHYALVGDDEEVFGAYNTYHTGRGSGGEVWPQQQQQQGEGSSLMGSDGRSPQLRSSGLGPNLSSQRGSRVEMSRMPSNNYPNFTTTRGPIPSDVRPHGS